MSETFKNGTKLYDPYFKTMVVVEKSGVWADPGYITGRYYTVLYPDGTRMDTHESAFTRPWLRERNPKGQFLGSSR